MRRWQLLYRPIIDARRTKRGRAASSRPCVIARYGSTVGRRSTTKPSQSANGANMLVADVLANHLLVQSHRAHAIAACPKVETREVPLAPEVFPVDSDR